MKRKDNKGFTLVELIVVLVILAILAAILVPALLGYIDKAREKQVTTNANAAYVAAQALATEYYGKTAAGSTTGSGCKAYVTDAKIKTLTDIGEDFDCTVDAVKGGDTATDKTGCIITEFTYKNAEYTAVWKQADGGNWTVTQEANTVTGD